MKRSFRNSVLLLAGLTLAGPALAEDVGPCGIKTKVQENGTVKFSNTETMTKCGTADAAPSKSAPTPTEKTASEPAPHQASTDTAAPATPAVAEDKAGEADPRQRHRDAMLNAAPGTRAANPALSRRYKMMNKETYQAKVLNGAAPTSRMEGAGTVPADSGQD